MSKRILTRTLPFLAILLGIAAIAVAENIDGFHQRVRRAYQRSYAGSPDEKDLEICAVCHFSIETPGRPDAAPSPGTYETYSSPTLDARMDLPGETSIQCLGCHDGVIADGDFSTKTPGIVLKRSHPIGMTYDTMLSMKDSGLHDPDATSSGLGGTITEDLLFNGRVECISCHNPHASADKLMKKSNQLSELCLTCHNK